MDKQSGGEGVWKKKNKNYGKHGVAKENDGRRLTWQLGAEVGRTREDVLPHKSASVGCTAINLNDLSPLRACFGIQEPRRGLLACHAAVHLGLLLPFRTAFLIRTCGWGEDWLQHTHYLPLVLGGTWLSPSSLRAKGKKNKKAKQNIREPLTSALHSFSDLTHVYVVSHGKHCWVLTAGCAVILGRQCSSHTWRLSDSRT